MQHARIQRRGAQVVRGRDGMDVAGQVQVEILHRDDLAVAAAGRAALDAEGRSLRGLADDGHDALAQVRTQRLRNTDGGGGLAFAERGGGDGGHVNVLAILALGKAVKDFKFDLGLVRAKEFQLAFLDAQFLLRSGEWV